MEEFGEDQMPQVAWKFGLKYTWCKSKGDLLVCMRRAKSSQFIQCRTGIYCLFVPMPKIHCFSRDFWKIAACWYMTWQGFYLGKTMYFISNSWIYVREQFGLSSLN